MSEISNNDGADHAETSFVPHHDMLLRGLGIEKLPDSGTVTVDACFLRFMIAEYARLFPFDAADYQTRYADIAGALQRGDITDGHLHFILHGFREGRLPFAVPFDPDYYLAHNPELAQLARVRGTPGLLSHYAGPGRAGGRAGHPDTEAAMRRWATAAGTTSTIELAARTIDNARVQPYLIPVVAPEPVGFKGGLVLGDDPMDRLLRHRRHHRAADSFPTNTEPTSVLPGEYVYAGPEYDHFGHVMGEMIHRVLPARVRFGRHKLLFVGQGTHRPLGGWDDLSPVMQAALRFLDVAPDDVTLIRDNRIVERLHVVQQGSEIPDGPAPPYLRLLNGFTPARLEALHDGSPAAPRLYVSRSRLREGGLILGETYLEALLEQEGWHIFHPQAFPLLEQMQAYHRAQTIIFAGGSACHGTELFGGEGLRHCVLLPRGHAPNSFFESILRPRSRRLDTLSGATLMGTAVAFHHGEPIPHLGISILNLPALAEEMRILELAQLPTLDMACYRAQARADLAVHLEFHRQHEGNNETHPTRLVPDAELTDLVERCEALLS